MGLPISKKWTNNSTTFFSIKLYLIKNPPFLIASLSKTKIFRMPQQGFKNKACPGGKGNWNEGRKKVQTSSNKISKY